MHARRLRMQLTTAPERGIHSAAAAFVAQLRNEFRAPDAAGGSLWCGGRFCASRLRTTNNRLPKRIRDAKVRVLDFELACGLS
jgi:hypothetical protein